MAGEKILLVDNEKKVHDTFLALFDEYSIVPAFNGREALEILRKPNDVDLVISDFSMPGLSGIDLAQEIKRLHPQLKIIILTGYSSKELAIEALRCHVDEYVEKPFDVENLKGLLRRMFHGCKHPVEAGYSRSQEKVLQAKRMIEHNTNKTLSLTQVARDLCLSPKYFSRLFREKTGRNFNQYRLRLRMNAAKAMLRKRGQAVNQIAYALGYHNPESFMKMFKKITSITPSEFRAAHIARLRNSRIKERSEA